MSAESEFRFRHLIYWVVAVANVATVMIFVGPHVGATVAALLEWSFAAAGYKLYDMDLEYIEVISLACSMAALASASLSAAWILFKKIFGWSDGE